MKCQKKRHLLKNQENPNYEKCKDAYKNILLEASNLFEFLKTNVKNHEKMEKEKNEKNEKNH